MRRPAGREVDALWFVAACTLLGAAAGILYHLLRG